MPSRSKITRRAWVPVAMLSYRILAWSIASAVGCYLLSTIAPLPATGRAQGVEARAEGSSRARLQEEKHRVPGFAACLVACRRFRSRLCERIGELSPLGALREARAKRTAAAQDAGTHPRPRIASGVEEGELWNSVVVPRC